FIICHNVFDISVHQGNPVYILFFGIYGLDAVATIVLRLKRREDIFKPHRTHFYQYLANEMGWSHTRVSLLYAIMQLCVNVLLLYHLPLGIALYVIIVFVYIFLRIRLQGSKLWTVNNA
ncbi:MAG: UDP-GlcNAc--UDP-phosphate GlcNAc-1-phosphate transferase, partial [Bacteroidia bacterium]